jgi:hypothetical protein
VSTVFNVLNVHDVIAGIVVFVVVRLQHFYRVPRRYVTIIENKRRFAINVCIKLIRTQGVDDVILGRSSSRHRRSP